MGYNLTACLLNSLYSQAKIVNNIVQSRKYVIITKYADPSSRLLGLRVRVPPGPCLSLEGVVCCQVEVSATGRSLVQRAPTECGVSQCDLDA